MLIELYRLLNDQAEQRDDGQLCIELQNQFVAALKEEGLAEIFANRVQLN